MPFLFSYFQVLVTTKNLAWTTDFRARLVVVKGTEQYDVSAQRYADMPLSGWFKMSVSVRYFQGQYRPNKTLGLFNWEFSFN